MSAPKQYQVTAATVVAQFDGHPHESYFGRGAILPNSVTEASIKHLLSVGLIEPVEPVEVELILVQPATEPPAAGTDVAAVGEVEYTDGSRSSGVINVTAEDAPAAVEAAPRRTRPARPAVVEA